MLDIAIIDYGMGNVRSISNAVTKVVDTGKIMLTADRDEILGADCIILPGVGAFPDAMEKLRSKNILPPLNQAVCEYKKPTLGICLGMQLMFDQSDEVQKTEGLGWIPGHVEYMKPNTGLRVPHVGWNELLIRDHGEMFEHLGNDKDFYFVHSLHVHCDEEYVLAEFEYGTNMVASVKRDNIIGMQFHPEKSQKNGLIALRAFFDWADKESRQESN